MYRTAQTLKQDLTIHFINFDLDDKEGYQHQIVEPHIHIFGKVKYRLFFPTKFQHWLKKISSNNPIFNIHSVFKLENFAFAYLLNKHKISYIFTPHDSYSPESMQKRLFLKRLLLYTTERYILKKASIIHAITRLACKYIRRYTNNHVNTVLNFILEPSLLLKLYPKHDSSKTICFIG